MTSGCWGFWPMSKLYFLIYLGLLGHLWKMFNPFLHKCFVYFIKFISQYTYFCADFKRNYLDFIFPCFVWLHCEEKVCDFSKSFPSTWAAGLRSVLGSLAMSLRMQLHGSWPARILLSIVINKKHTPYMWQ